MVLNRTLTGNIDRYPWYLFFRDCYFWGPAFFLFFSSVIPLAQVLWLEAIYYVSVALLEVPSGYLSDRFGRRETLVISSLCLAIAYLLFFIGSNFAIFALAQFFLAVGFAAASGTDTALHFESLKALKREDEYVKREARAIKLVFISGAGAALIGGLLAMGHLRWIYGASFIAALIAAVFAFFMVEPENDEKVMPMVQQVTTLVKKSWSRRFRFFTFYTLAMTILIHLPYEFYQPYLKLTATGTWLGEGTPFVAGLHLAATMLTGAWFTRFVKKTSHRCLIWRILIICALGQALLLSSMALMVSPVVTLLLIGRTAAKGISSPLVNAEISPLLERHERSTYLSLQSLLGRLGYGITLMLLPVFTFLSQQPLQGNLIGAAAIGLLLFGGILIFRFPREKDHHCCTSSKLNIRSLLRFKQH